MARFPADERFRAITSNNFHQTPEWSLIPPEQQETIRVVGKVLPFRTNLYVLRKLVDWSRLPDDPMYQLTVPQRDMLDPDDYETIREMLDRNASRAEVHEAADRIRRTLNPHPAGQMTHNVPRLGERRLTGLQHKYKETVLFFPAQGQTCHAYCTYCFRWAQFVGTPQWKFEAREVDDLVAYLKAHPDVTDVLVTGGDPLIMKTKLLRRYLEPLLDPTLDHVHCVRIGTKAPAYWPQRFVSDDDADELLRLFERLVEAGKHVAVMSHVTHPVELSTEVARKAVRRIHSTGAVIRMQAPLIRRVNDHAETWAEMWREGARLGMVPYYMFIERDTGPKNYFEVPLARAMEIFRDAFRRVSGLARTVRGPSMSAFPGKVRILGVETVHEERVFALDFLQARNPDWVGRPFFARFDPEATWLDELRPAFGADRFFFQDETPNETSLPVVPVGDAATRSG